MSIGIISWIVIGLIAGILGKLIMLGRDPGGFLLTIVIGMIGALVGGFVVQLLGGRGVIGLRCAYDALATAAIGLSSAASGHQRSSPPLCCVFQGATR
jgi:uncharacterized membrane protein YeaQ/YmgE (transglycosylase-associated protein family)